MYAKLFASILDSSLWETPLPTRVLFITMMAMADRKGYVYSSPRGLARRAVLPAKDLKRALNELLSPDPDSTDRLRNPEHEGRRLEVTNGGWRILNYEYYRDLRDEDERRDQNRRAQRESRRRNRAVSTGQSQSAPVSECQHSQPSESESHQSQSHISAEASNGVVNIQARDGNGKADDDAAQQIAAIRDLVTWIAPKVKDLADSEIAEWVERYTAPFVLIAIAEKVLHVPAAGHAAYLRTLLADHWGDDGPEQMPTMQAACEIVAFRKARGFKTDIEASQGGYAARLDKLKDQRGRL